LENQPQTARILPQTAPALLRYARHLLMASLLMVVMLLAGARLTTGWSHSGESWLGAGAATAPTAASHSTPHPNLATPTARPPAEPYTLIREVSPFTIIPDRPLQTTLAYTVQEGDTVFGIAEKFALSPYTIFWANSEILQDSVHLLYPGQVLRIPPVDGVIHLVAEGDTVESIAAAYGVEVEAIVARGYNPIRGDEDLVAGMLLIVPGGEREMVAWRPPVTVAGTDSYGYGGNTGACPGAYAGYGGTGVFTWPTDRHYLSGYDYGLGHGGIDLATNLGDPIYAADGGVVVYSGWNTWGYGNLVIVNHGNGYQSFYAHLSGIYYGCGAYVEKGTIVGAAGSTGRSSGPHLHFEIRYDWVPVNPWGYMP